MDSAFRQNLRPTQLHAVNAAGFLEPHERDCCGRCKHTNQIAKNSQMWCRRIYPNLRVSKFAICNLFERNEQWTAPSSP